MGVGKSIHRQDALEKVTGSAKYVEDLIPQNALIAKMLRSTIANGVVKRIDCSKAEKIRGVVKILTCFDVPQIYYATVAHPLSLDPKKAEVEDRLMLTSRVRYYGEEIAVVVAEDEFTAQKALFCIEVEYEEFKPLLSCEDSFNDSQVPIHDCNADHNIQGELYYLVENGNLKTMEKEEVAKLREKQLSKTKEDAVVIDRNYKLPMVQHAHIENIACFAYMEGKRITIVTPTQAPHVLRRLVSQAIDFPMGDIRVIKPYVGGGFGNKQDIFYEPILAYLTRMLGGRCICIQLSREETFVNSRVRHAMDIQVRSEAKNGDDGYLGQYTKVISNKGAYGCHGIAVPAHAVTSVAQLYPSDWVFGEMQQIFTNLPSSAAMRGYGIPQMVFALESQMEVLANKLNVDSIELRKKYMPKLGFVDPFDGFECQSNELEKCIDEGKKRIGWDQKQHDYANQTGDIRKGVGVGIFCYKSCVWPILLETASCRIILNQNGSLQVHIGATEIGQGSDTVFAQMASEVLCIPETKIFVTSTQDTDTTPYDPGSYASRQSYVSGRAVKKAALMIKEKILAHAAKIYELDANLLTINDEKVVNTISNKTVCTIQNIAMHSLYNTDNSQQISAEATATTKDNAFAFGACFADVEVDIPLGKIKINQIINVHDSGKILNPKTAEGQVHGGVAMAVGYALGEQMLFDPKNGKPLNNNFLDYKIPTSMDIPPIEAVFIESFEPTAPFGNKALGEPPLIPTAPAIRNAVYHATGVAIDELPMTPQKLVSKFIEAGLIEKIEA